jgi:hypothetical protein
VAVHAPGTDESDDLVYVIDAARSPGECRITEYSREPNADPDYAHNPLTYRLQCRSGQVCERLVKPSA